MATCATSGCRRAVLCRGLCSNCYESMRAQEKRTKGFSRPVCDFGGCSTQITNTNRRGLCKVHRREVFYGPVEQCRHPECTTRLRYDNRTKLCRLHHDKAPASRQRRKAAAQIYWAQPGAKEKNVSAIRRKNGFWPGLFEALLDLQGNKCAICSLPLTDGRSLTGRCADHCHRTRMPRGILCSMCNKNLGHYEKMRNDGAVYPRYDAYLDNPPAYEIHHRIDEQNYGQQEEWYADE